MEHCEIEIRTHTAGKVSLYRAKGLLETGGTGLCVTYPHEGETVVLRFEENVLVMERTSLSMRFARGEATKALIRTAGREGTLPLRTRYCALERSQDHHKITLKYELGEPAQKFILSIRIVPSSEER